MLMTLSQLRVVDPDAAGRSIKSDEHQYLARTEQIRPEYIGSNDPSSSYTISNRNCQYQDYG